MKNLYETDYYQWLQQQKDYLSNRQFSRRLPVELRYHYAERLVASLMPYH